MRHMPQFPVRILVSHHPRPSVPVQVYHDGQMVPAVQHTFRLKETLHWWGYAWGWLMGRTNPRRPPHYRHYRFYRVWRWNISVAWGNHKPQSL